MLERMNGGAGARDRRRLTAVAALLVIGLVAPLVPVSAEAQKAGWTRRRKLATGVVFKKIKDPNGPWRIFILKVNPGAAATLDTVLAGDRLPGFEQTSSMARRSGALAAFNGDYAATTGRPIHTFARDGYLDQTELLWGRNFSIDAAKSATYFGHPRFTAAVQDPVTGLFLSIERVNQGVPAVDEIAMYSPSGKDLERPPQFACAARLYPVDRPRLRTGGAGVDSLHTVDRVSCASSRLKKKGGVIIATPSAGHRATEIATLVEGQQLTLSWSLGWPGVLDTIGGNPVLVESGHIVKADVNGTTPFHRANPRTGVGVTEDGKVLLIAVDGRQRGYSRGMTLKRFARLFVKHDATWALNLDGGGSTTVVVDGQIKNRPSDGRERSVSSAIVVLPGADPGEDQPVPPPDDGGSGTASARTWNDVGTDAGSTGGLAAYLRAETGRVPASLRAAEKAFRAD